MDIKNLTQALHNRINGATDLLEILAITKTIQSLRLGMVNTVSTFVELSGLNQVDGELYFVESENRLYVGVGTSWHKIYDPTSDVAYAWGYNSQGQLGNASNTDSNTPVAVLLPGFHDVTECQSGLTHNVALLSNGVAYAWGLNNSGELGMGDTMNRTSPEIVMGLFTDWSQVSAGSRWSAGLRSNGTIWTWGNNNQGELGQNDTINRSSPVSLLGGFTDWTQVSAGFLHSMGLRSDGTVWTWGGGFLLGDNTAISKSSPVSIVGGFADWTSIAAGSGMSLALRSSGSLWAWGINFTGGLGDGTTTDRSSPVSVTGGFSDWVSISSQRGGSITNGSVAVRANGTIWSWGNNSAGQLGDGTLINRSSPISVGGRLTDWISCSAGWKHTTAIRNRTP